MVDHLVRIDHLGQVLARGTGLLALLAGRGSTLGPAWCRRLREPLGRRRHRGVPRVATETLLEISKACSQLGQLRRLRADHRLQLGILHLELLVGGSVGREIAGRNSGSPA